MVKSKHSCGALVFLCLPTFAWGVWNISLDADARYHFTEWQTHEVEIRALGAAVRKVFDDGISDRLILFGLAEAERNFSLFSLHEAYGRLKGPMGVWNVTIGRFGLPFGLLWNFSAARLLYQTAYPVSLGFDTDNGVMLSGIANAIDYAISFTQGYGHHHAPALSGHGLAVVRFGITPGDTEDAVIGISGAVGKTALHHDRTAALTRAVGAVDATLYLGRILCRMEYHGGTANGKLLTAGFLGIEYPLLPLLETQLAITLSQYDGNRNDAWYIGATFKSAWITIKGGYRYAYITQPHHQLLLQLYRLFAFSF